VAAAIGLAQLAKADDFFERRRAVAKMYTQKLAGFSEFVQTHSELENRQSSWHVCPIRLNLDALQIDRGQFIEELKARGVTCSVHWMPLHLHPYYRESYGYRPEDFPNANREWARLISLPIFPSMTQEEVNYVVSSIQEIALANRKAAATPALAATGTYGD
jgi:perosamine synthetase